MKEFFERLHSDLKSRSLHGMTNRELALMANISQQHINRLLNGPPSQLGKLRAETLLELFPRVMHILESALDELAEGQGEQVVYADKEDLERVYHSFHHALRKLRESGKTDEEIAAICGYDRSHINRIINSDPNRIGSMRLDKALKLFPQLASAMASIEQTNSPHAVVAGGNVEVHQDGAAAEKLERLAAFVLASSLSDEEKVAAMRLLH